METEETIQMVPDTIIVGGSLFKYLIVETDRALKTELNNCVLESDKHALLGPPSSRWGWM